MKTFKQINIKHTKVKRLVLLLTSLLIGCSHLAPKETYYHFRDNDFDKLLSFEMSQIIKYKNEIENENEIIFEVTKVSDDYKKQYTVTSMTAGVLHYFYYDVQEIELKAYPNIPIRYKLRRFPIDVEQAKDDDFTEYPSDFKGNLYFPYWNEIEAINLDINFDDERTSMLVNGINYENVYVFESGNPDPIVISTTFVKNVNTIYYDLHYGIIGFDDIDGREWRISD